MDAGLYYLNARQQDRTPRSIRAKHRQTATLPALTAALPLANHTPFGSGKKNTRQGRPFLAPSPFAMRA